jgi:hypothetical protein
MAMSASIKSSSALARCARSPNAATPIEALVRRGPRSVKSETPLRSTSSRF